MTDSPLTGITRNPWNLDKTPGGSSGGSSAALARESVSIAAPFEVGESPAGNYFSARVAEAEHDTLAASTFLRETLRSDPHNPELIERAFVAALANGDMPEAFDLAQKLVARDSRNSSARLTLTVRDFKAKSYAAARNELNAGVTGGQKDLTTILLTAWSYVGSGDVRRALALVDTMSDPLRRVSRFPRRPHARRRRPHAGGGRPPQGRLCGRPDHPAPDRRLCAQSLAPRQERRSQGRLSCLRQGSTAQSHPAGRARRTCGRQEARAHGRRRQFGSRRGSLRPGRLRPRRRLGPAGRRNRRDRLPAAVAGSRAGQCAGAGYAGRGLFEDQAK